MYLSFFNCAPDFEEKISLRNHPIRTVLKAVMLSAFNRGPARINRQASELLDFAVRPL